jgi:subtilase family serine protease
MGAVAATAAVATAGVVALTDQASSPPPVQARLQAAADASDSGVLSFTGARAQAKAGAHVQVKAAGEAIDHPLLPSECVARFGSPCYGPAQLRQLYGVDKLGLRAGEGRTVALIMPGINPVLQSDLEVYSKAPGLPAPKITVVQEGHPQVLDPNDFVQAITAQELELDAQMIHAMAPAARIVYVQTEADNANVLENFGGTIDSIERLSRHHVDAVSLSYGWFELNYAEKFGAAKGAAMIRAQAAGLARVAARRGITVISANGDTGPTGPNLTGDALYDQQTAAFIASSPYVTGVAGTELHADDQGNRTSPDTVWAERDGNGVATGGALSEVFARLPAPRRRWRPPGQHRRGDGRVGVQPRVDVHQPLPGAVRAAAGLGPRRRNLGGLPAVRGHRRRRRPGRRPPAGPDQPRLVPARRHGRLT